jgi:biopolymer transport protein ExbB
MGNLMMYWQQGDAVSRAVAITLLVMSIGSWVLVFWKGWVLRRVRQDLTAAPARYWAAADVSGARQALQAVDREGVLLPLADAAHAPVDPASLGARATPEAQLTRALRDALHGVLADLRLGLVWLATVGAVAPFVGLLGTVWGIYHAMVRISAEGSVSIDQIAGPVGEALVMTAAGLAVAIPAVIAYNVFGKLVTASEADLEGFAHDLRETALALRAKG